MSLAEIGGPIPIQKGYLTEPLSKAVSRSHYS